MKRVLLLFLLSVVSRSAPAQTNQFSDVPSPVTLSSALPAGTPVSYSACGTVRVVPGTRCASGYNGGALGGILLAGGLPGKTTTALRYGSAVCRFSNQPIVNDLVTAGNSFCVDAGSLTPGSIPFSTNVIGEVTMVFSPSSALVHLFGPAIYGGAIPATAILGLAKVALTGDYRSLVGLPTSLSQFANDPGFLTGGETVVPCSATPAFIATMAVNTTSLCANATFSLPAGSAGQPETLIFCQTAPGGFHVAAPPNVSGFFIASYAASTCAVVSLNYSAAMSSWRVTSVVIQPK